MNHKAWPEHVPSELHVWVSRQLIALGIKMKKACILGQHVAVLRNERQHVILVKQQTKPHAGFNEEDIELAEPSLIVVVV
uniref:Uncharacterized protein n=1 Tax=Arundo donax TaxID=35708 RepID=A0A0A9HSB9_ARUDO